MRTLTGSVALAAALLLTSCATIPATSRTTAEAPPPSAASSVPPTPRPTPEPGPTTSIEVTADGLTLLDADGMLVDELTVDAGSDAMLAELTTVLGEPSSVTEDTECFAPGTMITSWDSFGATMRVSPADGGTDEPFLVQFTEPDGSTGIAVRIPDGPAIGEDAGDFYASVPPVQQGGQGDGYGTMIYELGPGMADDTDFHALRGAGGYLDHTFVLKSLMTPASHSAFFC
jgi:hypothetical protein